MRIGLIILLTVGCARAFSAEPTAEQSRFFEEKVRPLLATRCFRCHSEKEHEADLRLDVRAAIIAGGETGPAIVPGNPEKSLLIEAVRYRSLEMPPDRRLPKQEVDILVKWVAMGAPWPGAKEDGVLIPRTAGLEITDKDRQYWAFQPIRRPIIPNATTPWDDHPIDAFIYEKLVEKEIKPSKSATKRRLIRRVYFDLIGLPPTFNEVKKFEQDRSPEAFAKLVDELLDRPQYGERWARHWLDVVRFAQTDGYERDAAKPQAWRYRDYVIRAFNEDKPFNRFVMEQLAGDELDDVTHDSLIATGYYRIGPWDDEPADKPSALYDDMADIVRTTGEAFLGLTIGCARCHDHKFDPIPQADFYRLLSFVRNIAPYGKDKSSTHWAPNPDAILTPLLTNEMVKAWHAEQAKLNSKLQELRKAQEKDTKNEDLKKQISATESKLKQPPWQSALSVREKGPQPPETRVLIRGNHLTPGKPVEPAFLTVTGAEKPTIRPVSSEQSIVKLLRDQGVKQTSGRRRVLAKWIASPENPLTARVIVNRLWHYHFGRGIVATPNDFGKTGRLPTHPKLLDWLAAELIENGWSLKHLHRRILLSNTWQQSSAFVKTSRGSVLDPDNQLIWRQNLRRAEAEVIRDSMLAITKELNLDMYGPGFYPKLSAEVLSTQSRAGNGWGKSDESQRKRRSIYIFVKRTLGVPMMESFDMPVPDRPEPNRQTTTIAPQALIMLNSSFVDQRAIGFSHRLLKETDGSDLAISKAAFRLALSREPTSFEQNLAVEFLSRSRATDDSESGRKNAIERFARLILNLNEFIYID